MKNSESDRVTVDKLEPVKSIKKVAPKREFIQPFWLVTQRSRRNILFALEQQAFRAFHRCKSNVPFLERFFVILRGIDPEKTQLSNALQPVKPI